jgi:hypothetical protein
VEASLDDQSGFEAVTVEPRTLVSRG